MSSPDPRIEAIFNDAVERPAGERESFLVEATSGDVNLLEAVRRLLVAHDAAAGALDPPLSPEIKVNFAMFKPETEGDDIGQYRLMEKIGSTMRLNTRGFRPRPILLFKLPCEFG